MGRENTNDEHLEESVNERMNECAPLHCLHRKVHKILPRSFRPVAAAGTEDRG